MGGEDEEANYNTFYGYKVAGTSPFKNTKNILLLEADFQKCTFHYGDILILQAQMRLKHGSGKNLTSSYENMHKRRKWKRLMHYLFWRSGWHMSLGEVFLPGSQSANDSSLTSKWWFSGVFLHQTHQSRRTEAWENSRGWFLGYCETRSRKNGSAADMQTTWWNKWIGDEGLGGTSSTIKYYWAMCWAIELVALLMHFERWRHHSLSKLTARWGGRRRRTDEWVDSG